MNSTTEAAQYPQIHQTCSIQKCLFQNLRPEVKNIPSPFFLICIFPFVGIYDSRAIHLHKYYILIAPQKPFRNTNEFPLNRITHEDLGLFFVRPEKYTPMDLRCFSIQVFNCAIVVQRIPKRK